ncbi:MAG: DUF2490 domain-containing protein [Chitinophagaceae bacterium]|jgi:hypothetical protein|nr:DUF2490 domain-containing protein [Chitinophagaceae bacterium]
MKKIYVACLGMAVLCSSAALAQNTRIKDYNSIGWYNYFGTFKLSNRWGIHTEYQFRRDEVVTSWQQSLLRVGVNYQVHPRVQLRAGYAWIETFAYGDIPINGMGKTFTEHRLYQMATITDKIGRLDVSHRLMLEQRWVGRYSSQGLTKEDEFPFLNRARYMLRAQLPLKGKEIKDKTLYLAAYNEIFVGFGKNVNENVFDQNRLALLLGYRISPAVRLEAGYLNQVVQLGREVQGRNVFQHNNGLILNANFNFDLSKRSR